MPKLILIRGGAANPREAWKALGAHARDPLERLTAAGAAYFGRRISVGHLAAGIAAGVAIGLWCRAELAAGDR